MVGDEKQRWDCGSSLYRHSVPSPYTGTIFAHAILVRPLYAVHHTNTVYGHSIQSLYTVIKSVTPFLHSLYSLTLFLYGHSVRALQTGKRSLYTVTIFGHALPIRLHHTVNL